MCTEPLCVRRSLPIQPRKEWCSRWWANTTWSGQQCVTRMWHLSTKSSVTWTQIWTAFRCDQDVWACSALLVMSDSGCKHVFCLECIREWRSSVIQSKETVRMCPVCRIPTFFIIPCERMIFDESRKDEVVRKYMDTISAIPCKWGFCRVYCDISHCNYTVDRHYDFGKGFCPFGPSCFYSHSTIVSCLMWSRKSLYMTHLWDRTVINMRALQWSSL